MTTRRWFEAGGFCLLFGALAYSWLDLAPPAPWATYALNPAYFALVAASAAAVGYAGLRLLPNRQAICERLLLAGFLVGMPVIYIWAALRANDYGSALLESLGLIAFGSCAVVGFRRSMLLLGVGIAAHGLAWDAWHHGHAGYIEPWYPLACFIVDIALGLTVAIQAGGDKF